MLSRRNSCQCDNVSAVVIGKGLEKKIVGFTFETWEICYCWKKVRKRWGTIRAKMKDRDTQKDKIR